MKKRSLRSRQSIPTGKVERISLSLAGENKAALESIAFEKRISIAWVIQDAISGYLLQKQKKAHG